MRLPVPERIDESPHWLAVGKPAGWLTLPDRHDVAAPNLYRWLQKIYPAIYIVHRLDKDTSGIVLFAKTPEAHRHLCRQFSARTMTKIYSAILRGVPAQLRGVIHHPIGADPRHPGRMRIHPAGKPSVTEYTITESFRHFSLAEVHPLTGRTHQIRVHFSAIGHPLGVDPFYGSPEGIYLSDIKLNYRPKTGETEKPLMNRLTLHARSLVFTDLDGKTITLTADYPKDFRSFLNHLRKYDQR